MRGAKASFREGFKVYFGMLGNAGGVSKFNFLEYNAT
jgi:hypothetical protein